MHPPFTDSHRLGAEVGLDSGGGVGRKTLRRVRNDGRRYKSKFTLRETELRVKLD